MKRALILFAKRPAAGQTKTRLAGVLGLQGAADLYSCFLRDALEEARRVPGALRALAYAPGDAEAFFAALAPSYTLLPQHGADLGERMDLALRHFLEAGYDQAALVGSDIPLLTAQTIAEAFGLLDRGADAVFGPADDGGYYLVALARPQPALLRSVHMSTPDVLRETLALAEVAGVHTALLHPLYDVDTPDDLRRLRGDIAAAPAEVAPHTRAFLALLTRKEEE
jgi:rSAM/selenodomain-associated transferase 1